MDVKKIKEILLSGNLDKFYKNKEWLLKRVEALKRDNNECQMCKRNGKATIEGRTGDMYIDEECYEDIIISIDYNFIDRRNFHEKCRKIKRWLNKIEENKLYFSDDSGVFYKVKKVEVSDDIERLYKVIGKFNIKFICDQYAYYADGEDTLTLINNMILNNEYEIAKPIYVIKGEGNVTLNINNNPVIINVGQEVTINTELELCFKNNQMINLALKQGRFEDLYLLEGENIISYSVSSGGVMNSIGVKPYWRTL